jgi:hypothetical protein
MRNIYELADSIEGMNDCAFCYHVNTDRQKNDFANWVDQVLGDTALSLRLEGVYDRLQYVEIIRKRIVELEKA